MTKRKTQEQFIEEVYNLVENEYTVLGEYVNTNTKILMKHNKCNLQWKVSPAHFLNGTRCPKCNKVLPYTTKTFKERVYELVLDKYEVLEEYVNIKTKILMRHNACGYEWSILPNAFLNGNRCPKCANIELSKIKTKTNHEFIKEVFKLVKNEYEFLEEYVGTFNKILVRHNKCGYIYKVTPSNFLQGKRCPKCAEVLPYTTESFKKKIFELVNDEYEVINDYISHKYKIIFKHNKCGYIFEMNSNNFLQGQRCPKCAGNIPYTTKTFKEKVYQLVGNEYDVLGEYINAYTKILMRHNVCKYEWKATPGNFISGNRCYKCAGNLPYTTETFKEKIKELTNDEYEVLGNYKNATTKILIKHKICGNEWMVNPNSILRGHGCPVCNESKGEKIIREILKNNNINFQSQYIFNDLLSINNYFLRFDFAIFDKNNNLELLVEYDGRQHYEWIEHMMSKKRYEILQYHDRLKDEYCRKNNISLLRIPYWEFDNIENILKDYYEVKN